MNSRQPLKLLARSRGYAPEPTAPATFTAKPCSFSRESHYEQRPAFAFVLAGDLAAVILNHAIHRAQPEPRTFSHRLGGIERIENPLRFANPRPSIRKLQHGLFALALCGNFQGPPPVLFQCVHGVLDDLDKRLKQLVGVALHPRRIGVDGQAYADVSDKRRDSSI